MQTWNWTKFCLGVAKRSEILQISDTAGSIMRMYYFSHRQPHRPKMPLHKTAGFLIGRKIPNNPNFAEERRGVERRGEAHVQSQKLTRSTDSLAFPCGWFTHTLRMHRDPDRWTPVDTSSFSSVSCVIIVWHQFSISKWDCCIKIRSRVALWPDLLSTRGYRKGQPCFSLMLMQNDTSMGLSLLLQMALRSLILD